MEYKDGVIVMKDSIEFKMLNVLTQRFNFNIELVNGNQSWGNYQNGVWTGVVGHLYYDVSYLVVSMVFKTHS